MDLAPCLIPLSRRNSILNTLLRVLFFASLGLSTAFAEIPGCPKSMSPRFDEFSIHSNLIDSGVLPSTTNLLAPSQWDGDYQLVGGSLRQTANIRYNEKHQLPPINVLGLSKALQAKIKESVTGLRIKFIGDFDVINKVDNSQLKPLIPVSGSPIGYLESYLKVAGVHIDSIKDYQAQRLLDLTEKASKMLGFEKFPNLMLRNLSGAEPISIARARALFLEQLIYENRFVDFAKSHNLREHLLNHAPEQFLESIKRDIVEVRSYDLLAIDQDIETKLGGRGIIEWSDVPVAAVESPTKRATIVKPFFEISPSDDGLGKLELVDRLSNPTRAELFRPKGAENGVTGSFVYIPLKEHHSTTFETNLHEKPTEWVRILLLKDSLWEIGGRKFRIGILPVINTEDQVASLKVVLFEGHLGTNNKVSLQNGTTLVGEKRVASGASFMGNAVAIFNYVRK